MVSNGCRNCYAQAMTKRYAGAKGWPAEFKPWTPANAAENVVLHPDRLEAPFSWRTPRRVFVNSMSDLFHEAIPDEFIDKVFAVMALTPQHTYQVLTKRPERMREYLTKPVSTRYFNQLLGEWRTLEECERIDMIGQAIYDMTGRLASGDPADDDQVLLDDLPLPNVWLGVTVENQRWADHRIPILLDTPAAVRFVSAEPLLQRIDLTYPGCLLPTDIEPRIDWVIVGGESGPNHRPFNADWARSIVSQCADAGVACFVKQLGGARPGNRIEDLPEDLRVREFPR